jgi:hypothetical protein
MAQKDKAKTMTNRSVANQGACPLQPAKILRIFQVLGSVSGSPSSSIGPPSRSSFGRSHRSARRFPEEISKNGEASHQLVDRKNLHCASPAMTWCLDADHGNRVSAR